MYACVLRMLRELSQKSSRPPPSLLPSSRIFMSDLGVEVSAHLESGRCCFVCLLDRSDHSGVGAPLCMWEQALTYHLPIRGTAAKFRTSHTTPAPPPNMRRARVQAARSGSHGRKRSHAPKYEFAYPKLPPFSPRLPIIEETTA